MKIKSEIEEKIKELYKELDWQIHLRDISFSNDKYIYNVRSVNIVADKIKLLEWVLDEH